MQLDKYNQMLYIIIVMCSVRHRIGFEKPEKSFSADSADRKNPDAAAGALYLPQAEGKLIFLIPVSTACRKSPVADPSSIAICPLQKIHFTGITTSQTNLSAIDWLITLFIFNIDFRPPSFFLFHRRYWQYYRFA